MRAFVPVEAGLACHLAEWERVLLSRLALEVVAILETQSAEGAAPGASADPAPEHSDIRPGESSRDRQILEALDFEPIAQDQEAAGAPQVPAGMARALDALLPPASQDPGIAREVAELTREPLRADKAGRLGRLAAELATPTGPRGAVLVPQGQESDWLGAMNDMRLVLAAGLGIDGPEDAEEVHALALQDDDLPHTHGDEHGDETAHGSRRRGAALVYTMVTWWQESLVSVVLGGSAPA